MITLLHGDNLAASYNWLQNLKKTFTGEILTLNAKNLTTVGLGEAIGQNALFTTSKLIVIEGLPKTSLVTAINEVGQYSEIIVWLDKKTTTTSLKAKVIEFKDSSAGANFKLADSFTARDFKACIHEFNNLLAQKTPPELIVGILSRQLKLMIMVKDAALSGINPYVVQKIKAHEKKWTQQQLKEMLEGLLKVDHQIKTGRMEASHALFNYLAQLSS